LPPIGWRRDYLASDWLAWKKFLNSENQVKKACLLLAVKETILLLIGLRVKKLLNSVNQVNKCTKSLPPIGWKRDYLASDWLTFKEYSFRLAFQ
jgi:hypothetical protein